MGARLGKGVPTRILFATVIGYLVIASFTCAWSPPPCRRQSTPHIANCELRHGPLTF
jgi:hypothetical protein